MESTLSPSTTTAVPTTPRLHREHATMAAMVRIYCHDMHGHSRSKLCPDCEQLLSYAAQRLSRCVYGEAKPTCVKCPIHCYSAVMRERARAVMRHAGPAMLWHHPILAIRHLLDGHREAPPGPGMPPKRD
jgi:hypothetical protein